MGARADFPYLYFPDLSGNESDFYNSRVCVKVCPEEDQTNVGDEIDCYVDGTNDTCAATADLTFVIYESVTFLNTYCLPVAANDDFFLSVTD
jgi:hypothetical protein